ncbi:hypothetical protein K505DRAFT_361199 [Melanomma pulvis-pyrius CBS 109.77]|uniref:Uncharacterized protein n=1 Tax=Melanomma pulvis-pyrius CBS 109.77 TaxID=1314802 RepID=A0A6A6XDG8_9PLEO|nr:hypothetical protein K505DRAFT_361199 [Melanomma pulvis-pyrius CBS 109.77]
MALGQLGILPEGLPDIGGIIDALNPFKFRAARPTPFVAHQLATSSCLSNSLDWVRPWPTTPYESEIQPQPTVAFPTPTDPGDDWHWPIAITPGKLPSDGGGGLLPEQCKKNCGNKHCRKFGCGSDLDDNDTYDDDDIDDDDDDDQDNDHDDDNEDDGNKGTSS